jgi:pimeloyl-[acyl-carrier protein] synthase
VDFNPLDPEFIANPYPVYHQLRTMAPVWKSPFGAWVLTRYDDVFHVLRDPRFGRRGFEPMLRAVFAGADSVEPEQGYVTSMLFRDPPDHTRLRALVQKAFTPRVVEALRPRIQAIVDDLLARVRDARAMDVIADLAYPLPVIVICEMLGVPTEDRDTFREWSLAIARALDAIGVPGDPEIAERGRAARKKLTAYFRDGLIPERRKHPREDLLSALIAVEEQGDRLTTGELLATCNLLFVAGHETTVNLIGNGLLALLRHADEFRTLREDPSLIESAIEELLRYDGPVQRTGRIPNADVEIGGQTIPKGDLVMALLGAANRDPAHFPDPDRLDFRRADNRHLAFGWGIHFCLGAPLARLEGQIAIGTVAARLPKLALATDAPRWRPATTLRGLEALPVTF